MDSGEKLLRNLCIAFDDALDNKAKQKLVMSDKTTSDIFKELDRIPRTQEAEQTKQWLEGGYGNALWYGDPCFPSFEGIERHIPYVLFYKGAKPQLCRSISIVGTRFPTEDALQRSFTLGLEAGINNIRVVSGLAQGIDQGAVRGALSAFGAGYGFSVIAVLGCGLEVDYPVLSQPLKDRILERNGTILSQFAPFTPGLKQNFPNRNVTLAALSDATVVVQAPEHSGALITADFALQLGREVLVSDIGIKEGTKNAGSAKLAYDGALSLRSLSDVYDLELMAAETKKLIKPFARYGDRNYTVIKTC